MAQHSHSRLLFWFCHRVRHKGQRATESTDPRPDPCSRLAAGSHIRGGSGHLAAGRVEEGIPQGCNLHLARSLHWVEEESYWWRGNNLPVVVDTQPGGHLLEADSEEHMAAEVDNHRRHALAQPLALTHG